MSDEKVSSAYEQTRTSYRPAVRGRKQMVVSGHNLDTRAAMRILDKDGNAVDAWVAPIMELASRGHKVTTWLDWAWKADEVCVIVIKQDSKTLVAGANPKRESYTQDW